MFIDFPSPSRPPISLTVAMSEPGQWHYVVVPAGSPPPSAADVLGLRAAGGHEPSACGTAQSPDSDANVTVVVAAAECGRPEAGGGRNDFPVFGGSAARI